MSDMRLRGKGESVRFWAKVNVMGRVVRPELGNCWDWTAGTFDRGYGAFRRDGGELVKAHRFSYEAIVGPIPDDLVPDHLCKNTGCVNPKHLDLVTDVENVIRGDSPPAENARKVVCSRNHSCGFITLPSGRRRCPDCYRASDAAAKRRKRERLAA